MGNDGTWCVQMMGHDVTKPTPEVPNAPRCAVTKRLQSSCLTFWCEHWEKQTRGINTGDLSGFPCAALKQTFVKRTHRWVDLDCLAKTHMPWSHQTSRFGYVLGCGNGGNADQGQQKSDENVVTCSWDTVASQPSVLFWNNFKKLTGLMCSNLTRPSVAKIAISYDHQVVLSKRSHAFDPLHLYIWMK